MKRTAALLAVLMLPLASCSRPGQPAPAQMPPAATAAPEESINAADLFRRKSFTESDRIELILANLIGPAKLDTLKGERAANSRLRKIAYWLEVSHRQGDDPAQVIANAQAHAGYAGTGRAREDKKALLRNLTILERLGCLTDEGMAKLRTGRAPTITRGPYAGDIAEVDHILPRSRFPQLDEKLFNLEFMPKTMNRRKSDTMGQRQRALKAEWRAAGLL